MRGRIGTSAQVKAANAQFLALGVGTGPDGLEPAPGTAEAAVRYGIDFAATAERADFKGAPGQALILELPVLHARGASWDGLAATVGLIGVGDGGPEALRQAGAKLARAARGKGKVVAGFAADSPARTEALVEGYLLGAYQPVKHGRSADAARPGSGDLILVGGHDRAAVARAQVKAKATAWARDLINWPSNFKSPAAVAERAAGAAASRPTVSLRVLGPDELAAEGLNAILAVGEAAWRGPAADPGRGPRLVVATHSPAGVKGVPQVVIVGKGITFDSGGLDLKPAAGQVAMKTDMAGAASALAAVWASADLALPVKVTAVAPLAQNSIGAGAYRPGDVIGIGGVEVEVGDTDAEGRLVLAAALAWAGTALGADYLIDIATLTGAARIALGARTGAVLTPDDTLAARIEEVGLAHGERWWRLPLVGDYREALTTPNADLNSVGKAGWGAGAITAGLFLERFARHPRWAHLDVAGAARAPGGQDWTPPGATGFGVRTLIALVERLA